MRTWIKKQSRKPWAIRFLRALVALYMWLLYTTARKRVEIHPETQKLFAKQTPVLIGNWHGRLFVFAPFWRNWGHLPLCVISSPHADGLIVGGAAEVLGLKPLRGTRGGKGGAKAMREGLRALKNKTCLMLNPDGPHGPRQVLGEGTAALAQLSGAPFIAITFSCSRGKIMENQWDKSLVPGFFAQMTFYISEPIYIEKDESRELVRQRLENFMNAQLWELDRIYNRPKIEQARL